MLKLKEKITQYKFIEMFQFEDTKIYLVEVNEFINTKGGHIPIDSKEFTELAEAESFFNTIE